MAKCIECGADHGRASEFCSNKCKQTFHNRRAMRGAIAYDMLMSMRFDRNGDIKMNEMRQLMQTVATEWRQEDIKAGRKKTWSSVKDWLAKNPWVGNFRRTYETR
jgi:hypothetical protein